MAEHSPLYRPGEPDVDSYDDNPSDYQPAPYRFGHSARADGYSSGSVPLFLSDSDGEPDPSEYLAPAIKKKRRASLSSKILAGVCAAAAVAVLVALFTSDATQGMAVNIKASMAAIFPAPSAAAQANPPNLTARAEPKDAARPSVTTGQTPGTVTMAAVTPAREDIKLAYQNALRGVAPATALQAEPPEPVVHRLDPDVIAALAKRADALIASGDVAAARLVLRRAADAGVARAAMTLAETYDPGVVERLGAHGFVPDVALARNWYEKAKTFGSAEATQRLEVLASRR